MRLGLVIALALLTACTRLRPPLEPPAVSVEQAAAAVAADAGRSDIEADATIREALAVDAGRNADACVRQAPQAAACLYSQGVALGLEARAHPLRASELLKNMLDVLARAEAAQADYDQAGPARVQALVLIKAPAWPLGPGDLDAGLAAARRAVALRPQYPPNLLALAEALSKNGDAAGARDSYARARAAAAALPATSDRDAWLRAADQALSRK